MTHKSTERVELVPLRHSPSRDVLSSKDGVRLRYIENLTDCLQVCLLKGDIDRASRAWAILIRCHEVNWKARWNWGLEILSARTKTTSSPSFGDIGISDDPERDIEKYLKSIRLSAREADKPSLLHALVMHYIQFGRYRDALDELETYLTGYPYVLSGPLHTYGGLISFYLAQPVPTRAPRRSSVNQNVGIGITKMDLDMDFQSDSNSSRNPSLSPDIYAAHRSVVAEADHSMLNSAKTWFHKALEIDPGDEVALEFLKMIDRPEGNKVVSGDAWPMEDEKMDDSNADSSDWSDTTAD